MKTNLLDLANNECRGEVKGGYCAERVKPGRSYCDACEKRMRRPTPKYEDSQRAADYVAHRFDRLDNRLKHSRAGESPPVPVDHFLRGRL